MESTEKEREKGGEGRKRGRIKEEKREGEERFRRKLRFLPPTRQFFPATSSDLNTFDRQKNTTVLLPLHREGKRKGGRREEKGKEKRREKGKGGEVSSQVTVSTTN